MENFYDFMALVVAPSVRRLDRKYDGLLGPYEAVTVRWSPSVAGFLAVASAEAWAYHTVVVNVQEALVAA